METSVGLPNVVVKVLLACGIIYALLTGGTDIVAGLLKPGYRFDSQTANLLGAFGTTTRPYVLPLNIVSDVLLIAFAVGVWFSVGNNWALRVMACLLVGNAVLSMLAIAFFPFHPNDPMNTPVNTANLSLMAPAVILFVLALVFGAIGHHNWFRYYSIGTILLYVLGFALAMLLNKLSYGGYGNSAVGIQERTMIYTEMVWVILQAMVLMRAG